MVEFDDQGRLHIARKLRDRYGERFWIVGVQDTIKLIPAPEDPVQALQDAMPASCTRKI